MTRKPKPYPFIRNMKKITMLLVMAIAFSLLSSGANNSYAAEVLRILSWEGYFPKEKVDEFEGYITKKYGKTISIEIQTAADEQDFFNAIRGQTADVVLATHNYLKDERFNYIKNKMILPINLENVPNYSTLIPAFQKMEAHVDNGLVFSVPFIAGPYGLFYNADIVKPEPESWSIFWDERYAGQYAVSFESYENNVYITVMGLGRDMRNKENFTIKNVMNSEFTSRLNALAKNADHHFEIYEKAEQIKNLAFSAGWGAALSELNKMGKNWKLANPSEGSMGWVDGYVIGNSLGRDDNQRDYQFLKKVAEEWMNFTLSPKFQLDVSIRFWSAFPTNLSVKPLLTAEEITSLHLDDLSYFEENLILIPTLTKRQRNGMKKIWEKALKK